MVEPDASDKAISAVLSQPRDDGKLKPIVIFSKKFSPAEFNYEIYDKELFVIIRAFKE